MRCDTLRKILVLQNVLSEDKNLEALRFYSFGALREIAQDFDDAAGRVGAAGLFAPLSRPRGVLF